MKISTDEIKNNPLGKFETQAGQIAGMVALAATTGGAGDVVAGAGDVVAGAGDVADAGAGDLVTGGLTATADGVRSSVTRVEGATASATDQTSGITAASRTTSGAAADAAPVQEVLPAPTTVKSSTQPPGSVPTPVQQWQGKHVGRSDSTENRNAPDALPTNRIPTFDPNQTSAEVISNMQATANSNRYASGPLYAFRHLTDPAQIAQYVNAYN